MEIMKMLHVKRVYYSTGDPERPIDGGRVRDLESDHLSQLSQYHRRRLAREMSGGRQ